MAKTVCLIPAKGASTRLPRKNIRPLGGITLLARAVEVAKESGVFSDIVVSSEDEDVLEHAQVLGAHVIKRPTELAVDPSGVEAVIFHFITSDFNFDGIDDVAILLPTCPFRTVDDLKNAVIKFQNKHFNTLMSVVKSQHSPFNSYADTDDSLVPLFPNKNKQNSQAQSSTYLCNGAIQLVRIAKFLESKSYTQPPIAKYVMPPERSVDIDTEWDWLQAEFILSLQDNG